MDSIRTSLICVILPAQAAIWTACCPDYYYEVLVPDPTARLPRDEAAHCSGGEWWYYTGTVTTQDGRSYGIETVIFHVPGAIVLLPANAWVGHFAVLEQATGACVYDQIRWLGPRIRDRTKDDGFNLYTPLVQMSGLSGHDHVRAIMSDGTYAIDLALDDLKGTVLHGGDGYVPYGADGSSFYYSRPRMQATGTMEIDGETHDVTGTFWFDRQWGRDLIDPRITWDWFSLRLDDGTDVMLFDFRDPQEPVAFGTCMPAVGDGVALSVDEFTVAAASWWTSPHTGRTYPVSWNIQIPSQQFALVVTAVAVDQEFDASSTTFNVYWEGLCTITGTRAGQPVTGLAYVELTNYP